MNIFSQYLQPVRGLSERMADLDAQDFRREQLTGTRQQNQFQALAMRKQMEAEESGRQQQQRFAGYLQQSGGDVNALQKLLSGDASMFDRAQGLAKELMEREKIGAQTQQAKSAASRSDVDADKDRLTMERTKADAVLQAVSAAKDPASYAQALQWLGSQGIDTSSIPQQFDPTFVRTAGQQAMTVKERADQEWKAKGYDLDVRKQGEVERQNRAQIATTQRGQNMTDARSREKNANEAAGVGKVDWKQDTNGNWVALPKEVDPSKGPVTPVMTTSPGKRETQAGQALTIIKEAEKIIGKGTSSYVGAAVDQAARVVGASNKGADAAAELKAMEGALMMAQPRMEGPQSNLDVELYRQMAARIGDPTIPVSQKRAALSRVKELHQKYAGPQGAPMQEPAPKANGKQPSVSNW